MILARDSDQAWSHFLGKIIVFFFLWTGAKKDEKHPDRGHVHQVILLDFDKEFFTSVTKEMTTGAMKSTQGLQQVMI